MDSAIYRHVMGQLKKSCLLSHNTFPSHNLLSQETLLKFSKDWNNVEESDNDDSQFLSSFPCYKQFDYDVQTTSALWCGSGVADVATELVKKKSSWERQLKNLKIHDIHKAVSCIRDLRKNKPRELSKNIYRLIDHFHNDPEPMFQGRYNWLYSGGNLVGVEYHNQFILFSSDYFDGKSIINILKLNDSLDEVECKSHCQLRRSSPILQISCKAAGDSIILFARQKNNTSLYRINDVCALSTPERLWRKKSSEYKLLTHADINDDCKEVLVSDTNHDVHIFDIEMRKKTFGYSVRRSKLHDRNRESWNQVFFGDSGFYLALRNCFCVVDSRDHGSKAQLMFTPPTVVNNCEEICSVTKSACDPNYLYLGTTHNVLQLDLRTRKPVQRWTHLMENHPQFIATVKNGREEFVVLQSHQTDETVGITNEYIEDEEGGNFLSRSLPCLLKGAKESLRLARLNGLCLRPSVAKRFDFAVTGVQCWQNNRSGVHLFTGNSGGDVFLSKITKTGAAPNGGDGAEEVLRGMEAYESHFEDFIPNNTFQSNIELINMKNVLTELKNSKLQREKYQKPDINWPEHESFAPESLGFYRDVLAQKILKVWGFEPQEPTELNDTTMSSDDKVREWMEKI